MTDRDKMNDLIKESTNVKLREDEFWFSYKNQRVHTWNLAKELKINDASLTDDECIEQAKAFTETFYNTIIKRR